MGWIADGLVAEPSHAILVECPDAKRPPRHGEGDYVMNKAHCLGATVLALSAAAASAQAVRDYGPYNYGYVAVSPLYDYAPAFTPGPQGYGPLVFAAPLYAPTPNYPAPPAELGYYTAQAIVVSQPLYDYPPGYWAR